jgi:integrase
MSVQKREWKDATGKRRQAWRVRWQEGEAWRSRTFASKGDATAFEAELVRRRRLGDIAALDAGKETLNEYVSEVWIPSYAAALAPKTQIGYRSLYATRIEPTFGDVALRDITTELIGRWQAEAMKDARGKVSAQKALTLLGNIMQRAAEGGRIQRNPARLVRRARVPKSPEVKPLSPRQVEAIRWAMLHPADVQVAASADGKRSRRGFAQPAPGTPLTRMRDATLVSVMAYAGLRPAEALRLTWGDVRETTLLVEAPKTNTARTVRLLGPLAADLREWRLASGRPSARSLIFPGVDQDNWRSREWARAVRSAGVEDATPYALRHSFASLLLAEGRNVIYVARQLGHGAELTLGTYGHVMEELEGGERVTAEGAIEAARAVRVAHELPIAAVGRATQGQ